MKLGSEKLSAQKADGSHGLSEPTARQTSQFHQCPVNCFMMFWKTSVALLFASSLYENAFAGRMFDVSQRRGYSPNLKRAPEPPPKRRFENETDSYRFYSNDTARE